MPNTPSSQARKASPLPLLILGVLALLMVGASRLPANLSTVTSAVWGVGAVAGLVVIVRQFRRAA